MMRATFSRGAGFQPAELRPSTSGHGRLEACPTRQGLTLLEVIIAMAIFLMALVPITLIHAGGEL